LECKNCCLMPNHKLVQTPNANFSRCIRHINGLYTQRFNRSHQCDGQLFRGRYKSILVDADSYLLQLMRYIHRNPLRVSIVEKLDTYRWSSHRGYILEATKWNLLYKDFILSILAREKKQQRRIYSNLLQRKIRGRSARYLRRKNCLQFWAPIPLSIG